MTSRELQNDLRRLQNGVPKSSRIPLRHPVAPRGAAQTTHCKPLEREHQFHRPARSTQGTSHHAAPPVVRLVLSPSSLTFSHLLPSTSLPPRRTHGVGGLGAGGGWGWVLLGSMGLVVSPRCQKLYGLVRKPLATLHRAAGEPFRQAPNKSTGACPPSG